MPTAPPSEPADTTVSSRSKAMCQNLNFRHIALICAPSWESFEAVFLEMHPGFSDSLRRDFPALTRNDIQLCALIRMEMDTKQSDGNFRI